MEVERVKLYGNKEDKRQILLKSAEYAWFQEKGNSDMKEEIASWILENIK